MILWTVGQVLRLLLFYPHFSILTNRNESDKLLRVYFLEINQQNILNNESFIKEYLKSLE